MKARLTTMVLAAVLCLGCAAHKYDYALYRDHFPASIVVVPPINNTSEAAAPDTFLASVVTPLAERGYYVYPVPLVIETLDESGLSDPAAAVQAPVQQVGGLFGADAVLYTTIDAWRGSYGAFYTRSEVAFSYVMKDVRSGETIWKNASRVVYTYDHDQSFRAVSGVSFGVAVTFPIGYERPDIYMAEEANRHAFWSAGTGLPSGRYSPKYGIDWRKFPGLAAPPVSP